MRAVRGAVISGGAALALYTAPATARLRAGRAAFPAITRVASRDSVALTFDDGPDADTERFLDLLDAAGARATFFLVGEQVVGREETVREIVGRGHEVAAHCYHHRSHLLLSPRQTVEDMRRARSVVEEASGTRILPFRPPYGVFNAASWSEAGRQGWRRVLWSRRGEEWRVGATIPSVVSEVGSPVEGDILLLHDSSRYGPGDAARLALGALPRILDDIRDSGLRARSVGELLDAGWR